MNSSPCKNCYDRKLGCHDVCEKYLAFKRNIEELRKKKNLHYVVRKGPCLIK